MTNKFASPVNCELGNKVLRTLASKAASPCISPSTSSSGERDLISANASRILTADGLLELTVDGLTTQGKYYKPLIYEFFRKAWRGSRPSWGEFSVEIGMEYVGEPPWLDLDNLAKAILDSIKGYAFHDDAQVARLLVERRAGERERIAVTIRKLSDLSPWPKG